MADSSDDILSKELAKLGSWSGRLGSLLGGGDADAGEKVTSLSVQLTARFLATERYTEKFACAHPADKVLKYGYSVLSKLGAMQNPPDAALPYPFLSAVIGSGFRNLNPALVYFEILESGDSSCVVTITGAAKEGLIKQHTAEKAVKRVITELNSVL